MPYTLTQNQLDSWTSLLEKYRADAVAVDYFKKRDQQRQKALPEMLDVLKQFLDDKIGADQFKNIYQKKTSNEWDYFGLKGLSGAMFLNMIVKNVPDTTAVTAQLRAVLPLPGDSQEGENKQRAFYDYLQGLIAAGQVGKQQLQPNRIPYFVGSWWHLQSPEQWPIYYTTARQALQQEGMYTPSPDPVQDYFTFRDAYLALMQSLSLSTWELEHVCVYLVEGNPVTKNGKGNPVVAPPPAVPAPPPAIPLAVNGKTDSGHTEVQYLLAKIGQKLGYQIWIAGNDQSKTWQGQKLGDFSVKSLPPLGMDNDSNKIVSLIDVVWLKGNKVVAAFEVEHTTSIYSGLLRMSDLVALSPNLTFPLYIVTPQARMNKVQSQLERPTFQMLELHKRCKFFSEEDLREHHKAILLFAKDYSAIDAVAKKVDDVTNYAIDLPDDG